MNKTVYNNMIKYLVNDCHLSMETIEKISKHHRDGWTLEAWQDALGEEITRYRLDAMCKAGLVQKWSDYNYYGDRKNRYWVVA